jgi:hypothetical protein
MSSANVENDEPDQHEENENKFSLIVRKPQEGKTYICIASIVQDKTRDIHIVLTMNTLSAGMQFFGRLEDEIGYSKIIVLNSDSKTAGKCHHSKTTTDVIKLLKKYPDIKVIVCCAHYSRFKISLNDIFDDVKDSFQLRGRNFKIHIDEAHKYISEYRNNVREFNMCNIITKIIGYTATPRPIYSEDKTDKLFYEIYICDVEKELNLIRSPYYYGVKDCNHLIIENEFDDDNYHSNTFEKFYGSKSKFNFGNEISLFKYVNMVLPTLNIKQDEFSYNFVPAYHRKVTHIETAHIILNHYPNSNIIIINGDGIQLCRGINNKLTIIKRGIDIVCNDDACKKFLLEPSNIIQTLIENTPNFPTFITGFSCVGMSVTLINEKLGHFDNIIMKHTHCSKDDLYQLCRFLFNYSSWSNANKEKLQFKKSLLICSSTAVYSTIFNYEEYIEKMIENNSGSYVRINNDDNIESCTPSDSQIRRAELNTIEPITNGWRVYDVDTNIENDLDNDKNFYNKSAEDFYKNITGKSCDLKSKPKRDTTNPAFWACSLSKKTKIHSIDEIDRAKESTGNWDSYFQLGRNKLNYCTRFFVAYYNLRDSTKYKIYMKYAKLKESDIDIINKYCNKPLAPARLNILYDDDTFIIDDASNISEQSIINDETSNMSDETILNNDALHHTTQYKRPKDYAIKYLHNGWKLHAKLKDVEFICKYNKTNDTFETLDTSNKLIFNSLNKAHKYHVSLVVQKYKDYCTSRNAWDLFKLVNEDNTLTPINNFDNHK